MDCPRHPTPSQGDGRCRSTGLEPTRSGSQPGSNCSRRKRSSRAAATNWPVSGRSCHGCRSKKDIDLRQTTAAHRLPDLFRGRSQLLVYHFMFGPDYTAGCPSCSAIADGFNGIAVHLANHDVMLWAASLAPLAKLQAYKRRMGWTFPWASSPGSDFNFDFNVSHHRGAAARRKLRVQLSARRPRNGRHTRAGAGRRVRRRLRDRRAPPTRATGRA